MPLPLLVSVSVATTFCEPPPSDTDVVPAPIATVAALRETSIVFALLLSARYLKETLSLQRVIGGILIAAGAVLLRVG